MCFKPFVDTITILGDKDQNVQEKVFSLEAETENLIGQISAELANNQEDG